MTQLCWHVCEVAAPVKEGWSAMRGGVLPPVTMWVPTHFGLFEGGVCFSCYLVCVCRCVCVAYVLHLAHSFVLCVCACGNASVE